jgi:hypothetical protein
MPSVFLLIQKTLRIYKHYLAIIAGYVAWLLIPYAASILTRAFSSETLTLQLLDLVFMLIFTGLSIWVFLILARFFAAVDRGHKQIELAKLQTYCARRIPNLLWVIVLTTLTIVGGLIFFIIPGLIFYVWYAFSQMAVIVDEKNGTDAMTFSHNLVKGRFFSVAWLLLGGPILFTALYSVLVSLIASIIAAIIGFDFTTLTEAGAQIPVWFETLQITAQLFFVAPLSVIYIVVLYDWLVASKLYPDADQKESSETE